MNKIAVTVLEATLTLYLADSAGAPVAAAPVWFGSDPEALTLTASSRVATIHPTARAFPLKLVMYQTHEIRPSRVWWLGFLNGAFMQDFEPTSSRYVLDVVWTDADTGDWKRRVYYGVTLESRELRSRGYMESGDDQAWSAEQYVASTGSGLVPSISPAVPQIVRYIDSLVAFDLYSYDPTGGLFTEAIPGLAVLYAVLAYSPADRSGTFTATFAGAGSAAMTVGADGSLTTGAFVEGVPDLSDVPRLDFMNGRSRIASVSAARDLFAAAFTEAAPVASPVFSLYGGGAPAVSINPAGITAAPLEEGA